jgi:quinol-cytochrome oxidoreductase complex cytochrome b subunit
MPPLPPALKPRPSRPGTGNGRVGPLDQAAEAGITVVDWIDERTSLSGGVRWMLFRKVPKGTNWFYTLGSAAMFAFLSQAVTGIFLAMYYDPSPTRAYESIRYVTNEAFLGEFVRGMHKWGSTVMVILVFLHMGRTFFFGAYKYPRELNWVIGVVLLIMTMTMSFTGYLLPFDQRFYAIHMMLVPGLIAALIGAHLYLVAKLGTTAPPWIKAKPDEKLTESEV